MTDQWFKNTSRRYIRWAEKYMSKNTAVHVSKSNVAATEWPLAGSVFYLLTAEEIFKKDPISFKKNKEFMNAVELATAIVADPATANWVRQKWGDKYLEKQNAYYREMLLLGLTASRHISGKNYDDVIISQQAKMLSDEIFEAPKHLLDDYPGECYPMDVLWAVAAIKRSGETGERKEKELINVFFSELNGSLKDQYGLPVSQFDLTNYTVIDNSRGCANSGLIIFTSEIDTALALNWYCAYTKNYWVSNSLIAGFREYPPKSNKKSDIDSGPILWGFGSVASVFGIGAAKTLGRFDHSAPLTVEAVCCLWPTPFGFLTTGIPGWKAAGGWCLGETVVLFVLSRPVNTDSHVDFNKSMPVVVWVFMMIYLFLGCSLIYMEVKSWRRLFKSHK